MNMTARVRRSGGWWAVEVPEIPGLFTQAKRLGQVAQMVADAAEMLGHPQVEVAVEPQLAPSDRKLVDAAIAGRARLRQAETAAATASRAAVAKLRSEGLPVRDVATLMGISPQRVSALAV